MRALLSFLRGTIIIGVALFALAGVVWGVMNQDEVEKLLGLNEPTQPVEWPSHNLPAPRAPVLTDPVGETAAATQTDAPTRARPTSRAASQAAQPDVAAPISAPQLAVAPNADEVAAEPVDLAGRALVPARAPAEIGASAGAEDARGLQFAAARDGIETSVGAQRRRPAPPVREQKVDPDLKFDVVRVTKKGQAVIAGRARPGQSVRVIANGQVIATARASGTGEWAAIPSVAVPPGPQEISLEVGPEGRRAIRSEQRVVVVLSQTTEETPLVVLSEPGEASRALQRPDVDPPLSAEPAAPPPSAAPAPVAVADVAGSDQADAETPAPAADTPAAAPPAPVTPQLASIDYDDEGRVLAAGEGRPGAVARLYLDTVFLGEAAIDDEGGWTVRPDVLVRAGAYTLRLDQVDATGKVEARIEVPFTREPPRERLIADGGGSRLGIGASAPRPRPGSGVVIAAAEPTASVSPTSATSASGEPAAVELGAEELAARTEIAISTAPAESLPVAEAEPAPAAPRATGEVTTLDEGAREVEVLPGDTLWRISVRVYGVGERYTLIYKANAQRLRDPDDIRPGQILTVPGAPDNG